MSCPNIGNPISHRLVHRFLQCFLASRYPHHLGPQKPHSSHIQRLSPHVLFPHINNTLHPIPCRHGGRRDSVLPSPRLGNNPLFAHPTGQNHLAECIVDLVRSRMKQVFPFQINFCPATSLRESLRKVEGRGATRKITPHFLKFMQKCWVFLSTSKFSRQLLERGDKRLWNIPPPIGPKVT